MAKIFTYQTYLRIQLTAGVNVTGALDTRIFYKKPGGTVGDVPATVSDSTTGVMYYDLLPDSSGNTDFLDEVGRWRFWTYVIFADGREARGESVTQQIDDYQDVC